MIKFIAIWDASTGYQLFFLTEIWYKIYKQAATPALGKTMKP